MNAMADVATVIDFREVIAKSYDGGSTVPGGTLVALKFVHTLDV